jgi:hypothetical protein
VEKGPSRCQTGQEIIEELNNLNISDGEEEFEGYGKEHNWIHKCGLCELPYTGKIKDNKQVRKHLAMIYHRPSLQLLARGTKPQALFYMKAKERKEVLKWMKNLNFADGFAASFRRVVNLKTWKLTGLKSHDYQVIMEWLLSNMLWGYVHQDVWKRLAELSYFYRQLCAK